VVGVRINYLLLVFSFGSLRPEQAMRSMDLFCGSDARLAICCGLSVFLLGLIYCASERRRSATHG